ncbi:MAG: ABC transporter permease subunit [Ktedonobacterales bacterium]|nr:ABC transporter permease subunit [Ktedonobacterales bacterium]
MWFSNVFLKTLREYRIAILGWGVGLGLLMYAVLTAVASLTATQAARDALTSLAASFVWIAEPVKITTPGGYATWKYGFTILIMALWPLLVGSRLLRGEEERGSLDVLLSVPQGRGRVALEKLAALWMALLGMGLIIGLLSAAGGAGVHADFGLGGGLLFGLNLVLISAVFGGIALLISQFTLRAGTAAGATGALLLFFIILDMLHRVISNTEWLSRLSPVYYYNLSKPLIPSYGVNLGALLVLFVLSVVLSGGAIWLFVRRDVGTTVALPRWLRLPTPPPTVERGVPMNAWSLRSVYARGLAMVALPTLWWTLAIAGFAGFMVLVVKQTESKLAVLYQSSPTLANLIGKVGGSDVTTNATLLSFLFVFLPLLLMAFAVTQASRWAADEENGRQELVLSTPQSRLTVVLARFGAVATATVFIGVMTLAVTALASAISGLKLDGGNLTAATLSMIPLGLLVAALGFLLSGWLRAAVDTGLLSFLLVLWFFITFVGPELNWSEGLLRLSAFYYYGTPLLHGLPLLDTLALFVVGVVALALAAVRFVRKDIAH